MLGAWVGVKYPQRALQELPPSSPRPLVTVQKAHSPRGRAELGGRDLPCRTALPQLLTVRWASGLRGTPPPQSRALGPRWLLPPKLDFLSLLAMPLTVLPLTYQGTPPP